MKAKIMTIKRFQTFAALLTLAIVTSAVSCKRLPSQPEDLPKLYPTTIEVTFGGEIVPDVSVIMTPTDAALKKWKSGGKTDEKGRCVVKTAFCYDGAPQGSYKLAFSKLEERIGDELEDMQPLSLIPMKYLPQNTELTLDVKPEKNVVRLELDGGQEIFPVPKGTVPSPRMKRGG